MHKDSLILYQEYLQNLIDDNQGEDDEYITMHQQTLIIHQ